MGEFLVSSSALNFLACRVILELKTALDKAGSAKGKGERSGTLPSTIPSSYPSGSGNSGNTDGGGAGGGFGVDGFISAGGNVGPSSSSSNSIYPSAQPPTSEEYDLPLPQEVPTYKPVDIIITKQDLPNSEGLKKNCIVCAASIPKQAKFCNKCGNSQ
jgi:hypothetical protein